MKRLLYVIPVLVLILMLASCGNETVSIEGYEWKLRAVMKNDVDAAQDEDALVIAVGENDELYPDAKIVDVKLTAKNEKITVVDSTNDKTYSGTYKQIEKTPDGITYEMEIDGKEGFATVSPTEHYEGTDVPTLPINMGEYSVYFIPAE